MEGTLGRSTPICLQPKFNRKKHRQRAGRWICLVLFKQVAVAHGRSVTLRLSTALLVLPGRHSPWLSSARGQIRFESDPGMGMSHGGWQWLVAVWSG